MKNKINDLTFEDSIKIVKVRSKMVDSSLATKINKLKIAMREA